METRSKRKDPRSIQNVKIKPCQTRWAEGEMVEARWRDLHMYPAKITKVHGDERLTVLFTDGISSVVPARLVKKLAGNETEHDSEKKNEEKTDETGDERVGNHETVNEIPLPQLPQIQMAGNDTDGSEEKNEEKTDETEDERVGNHETMNESESMNEMEEKYMDSTDSYVPPTDDDSSWGSDDEIPLPNPPQIQMAGNETEHGSEEKTDSTDSYVPSTDDDSSWGSDDEIPLPKPPQIQETTNITVLASHSKPGKRCYDKVAYCFICMKPQKKLSVHFKQHPENRLVSEILSLPPKSKERAKLLKKAQNIGNHKHNIHVLEEGRGEIIVVRRPAVPIDHSHYRPCTDCLGWYSRKELWKHVCVFRENQASKRKRSVVRQADLMMPPIGGMKNSDALNRILCGLREDNISRIVKSDPCILALGKKLSFKLGHDQENDNYIRTKLRELARLLNEFRKNEGKANATLVHLLDPLEFSLVTEAARRVGRFDDEKHTYATPSVALKLGHLLKNVCSMEVGRALMSGDETLERRLKRFLELLDTKWTEEISSHALRSLYEKKRNHVQLLPFTEDVHVVTLSQYLKTRSEDLCSLLSKTTDLKEKQSVWKDLSQVMLSMITTFNRRRQGEVSRMKLDDYSHLKRGESNVINSENLGSWESALVQYLWRTEIRGKRGRTVPVLFTENMKEVMDMLNKERECVGVADENQFVFAVPSSSSHFRGCDCLREHAKESGAKRPDLLRSTALRKQLATMAQVMNLQKNELDVIAKFLGHDVRIHREFYRMPDATMQVAKVSKLLMALEGKAGDPTSVIKNKSLDELQLDEDLELGSSHDESGTESSEEPELLQSEPLNAGSSQSSRTKLSKTKPSQSKCRVMPKRRPWSKDEKRAVLGTFKQQILVNHLPGKGDIEKLMRENPVLKNRSWRNIKDFVRNYMKSKK